MFERIILRRSVDGPAITAGEIAEAMLFYQNVHILLDFGTLSSLIQAVGMQAVLNALSIPGVKATYVKEMTGTQTVQTLSGPEYSLIAFSFAGHKSVGALRSRSKRVEYMLTSRGYKKSEAKKYAERFCRLVRDRKLTDNHYLRGGIMGAAQQDLIEKQYVHEAALIAANSLLGREIRPKTFQFDVQWYGDKFRVVSNLDFEEISRVQQLQDPSAGHFTPANITSTILTASVDTLLAGFYGGDYYTSSTVSKIIQLRERQLLRRVGRDQQELTEFKEIVLDGTPNIADVINRGERSFDEFLQLIKKAGRFKKWLRNRSPDESLVGAYLEDVTSVGWLGALPGKVFRFLTNAAAGAVNPASGLVVSAADSFLLEKLAGGWRPNHFIAHHLKSFLKVDKDS